MIIPTIFVLKGENFEERFRKVTSISNLVQIDFMDGFFVNSESVDIEEIPDLNEFPLIEFEAHLMVDNPESIIEKVFLKGFKRVIFHFEATSSLNSSKAVIETIRRYGLDYIIAINPETSTEELVYLSSSIKKVLLLGVHPGVENQSFIEETYDRVKNLKQKGFFVQVDGGVNEEVAEKLGEIGCDAINSGSYISNSVNPENALLELKLAFEKGRRRYLDE